MPDTEQLDHTAAARAIDRQSIPNIDLTHLADTHSEQRQDIVTQARAACESPGFFYVHNTGISDAVTRKALDAMTEFFALPDDSLVKQAVHNRHGGSMKGWGPLYSEPAYQPDTVAHVEVFDLGQQLSAAQYAALDQNPNLWPDLAGFRDAVQRYYDEVTLLADTLSEVFCEILGADRNFLRDHSGQSAPRTMRLLHYPANDGPDDGRHVGIAAHTDFECFTLMHQTASGLELTHADGGWCEAPSDIGAYTVILGDMMERLSNGVLKATGHRVRNTAWTRYSMVLFYALDAHYSVAPLSQFVDAANPARYPPVAQGEHIRRELAKAEAKKTTP